jgi:hypothetical protein
MTTRPNNTARIFPSVDEPAVYSIRQFIKAHNISYGKFYQMCREGKGPKLMKVGTLLMISVEEAARWRAERSAV